MELLTKFPDCMRDEVNRQAASKEHKHIYGEAVKKMIGSFLRATRLYEMPSACRNILLARARNLDLSYAA
jgi:hypothetical protein